MKTYAVVVGVVKYRNKILLLKRNANRKTSPNKWQPVSGFIGNKESGEEAVLREVEEETGLKGEIAKSGKVFEITDSYGRWVILPFLISVNSDKVTIDPDEHTDFVWVIPPEDLNYDCVKGVKEDLEAVGLL